MSYCFPTFHHHFHLSSDGHVEVKLRFSALGLRGRVEKILTIEYSDGSKQRNLVRANVVFKTYLDPAVGIAVVSEGEDFSLECAVVRGDLCLQKRGLGPRIKTLDPGAGEARQDSERGEF